MGQPLQAQCGYNPMDHGARCDICPLAGRHPPVPPRGPSRARVVIMGESPGRREVEKGEPFVGDSGRLLLDLLAEAGKLVPKGVPPLRKRDLWITNAILCKPGQGLKGYLAKLKERAAPKQRGVKLELDELMKRAKPSPLDCCWPRLVRELAGRDVIIPVGAYALRAIDRTRDGILKWRGSPFKWEPEVFLTIGTAKMWPDLLLSMTKALKEVSNDG